MSEFLLDSRLEQDCHRMLETPNSLILLLDNALYHWWVLVPKTTYIELYELDVIMQQRILAETMLLSRFVKEKQGADKLNIGAIGNIVQQLHIHIIGRNKGDAVWPDVVWGAEPREGYSKEHVDKLREQITQVFTYNSAQE